MSSNQICFCLKDLVIATLSFSSFHAGVMWWTPRVGRSLAEGFFERHATICFLENVRRHVDKTDKNGETIFSLKDKNLSGLSFWFPLVFYGIESHRSMCEEVWSQSGSEPYFGFRLYVFDRSLHVTFDPMTTHSSGQMQISRVVIPV